MRVIMLSPAALVLAASVAQATDIDVPADQPTIQQAIVAAQDGDRVLVAPGTYVERIDFLGKAIQVIGTGGASVTTLDGGGSGRAVTFRSGETAQSVLTGFTVTNGLANGSGVDGYGGGILATAASPTITGNVIRENKACAGGGIALTNGAQARISKNTVQLNQAYCDSKYGGGIYQDSDAVVEITDNRITHNSAWYGAGVAMVGALPDHEGKVVLMRNVIEFNSGAQMGGGVFSQVDHARLYSNLIANNKAIVAGGVYVAADIRQSHPILANNTFADNTQHEFEAFSYGQVDLMNNIFRTTRSDHIATCQTLKHGAVTFSGNLAFSTNGATLAGDCTIVGSMLDADPQFVGGGTGPRAFRLQATSPAIDVGDNAVIEGHDRKDLLGGPRIVNGTVDLGALEYRGE